jgi:hypothetical protein
MAFSLPFKGHIETGIHKVEHFTSAGRSLTTIAMESSNSVILTKSESFVEDMYK